MITETMRADMATCQRERGMRRGGWTQQGQGEEEQCRCARRSATESTLQILFDNIEGSVGQAREQLHVGVGTR